MFRLHEGNSAGIGETDSFLPLFPHLIDGHIDQVRECLLLCILQGLIEVDLWRRLVFDSPPPLTHWLRQ